MLPPSYISKNALSYFNVVLSNTTAVSGRELLRSISYPSSHLKVTFHIARGNSSSHHYTAGPSPANNPLCYLLPHFHFCFI